MLGHWFIVTGRKTAKIFTEIPNSGKLKLLKVFDNPLGREKNRALVRKQAGMGTRTQGRFGAARYMEPKRHDPHEQASVQFARQLAQFLDEQRLTRNFESLTIAAEPHFMGKLRAEMKPRTETSVVDWIKKDFQKLPATHLPEVLKIKKIHRPLRPTRRARTAF